MLSLILNIVLLEDKEKIMHLSLKYVEKIISANKPKLCVLTHFGMSMIIAKPWEIAENLSEKLGIRVIAASDGMELDLDKY